MMLNDNQQFNSYIRFIENFLSITSSDKIIKKSLTRGWIRREGLPPHQKVIECVWMEIHMYLTMKPSLRSPLHSWLLANITTLRLRNKKNIWRIYWLDFSKVSHEAIQALEAMINLSLHNYCAFMAAESTWPRAMKNHIQRLDGPS